MTMVSNLEGWGHLYWLEKAISLFISHSILASSLFVICHFGELSCEYVRVHSGRVCVCQCEVRFLRLTLFLRRENPSSFFVWHSTLGQFLIRHSPLLDDLGDWGRNWSFHIRFWPVPYSSFVISGICHVNMLEYTLGSYMGEYLLWATVHLNYFVIR